MGLCMANVEPGHWMDEMMHMASQLLNGGYMDVHDSLMHVNKLHVDVMMT